MNSNRTCKLTVPKCLLMLSSLFILLLLVACGDNPTPTNVLPSPSVQNSSTTITASATPTSVSSQNSTTSAPVSSQSGNPTSGSTTPVATTATSLPQVQATTKTPAVVSSPTPASTRNFERVFTIVLENADYSRAMTELYLANLTSQGAFLTNFYAVTHPSYPNYLAMVAGSTFGITGDEQTDLAQTSLVDLMEAKGLNWKSYTEQYPTTPACFKGVISNGYYRKHQPFLSFTSVQNDPTRCRKIVPADQLQKDLAAGSLPAYSLYIPDINNDGHDTGVHYAAKWLDSFLTPLMKNPEFSRNTLVVVTFDEGDNGTSNQIYTLLLGEPVKAGIKNNTRYNHYSLLRTIEDNFDLGNLGREDAKATPITGVWNTPSTH